MRRKDREITDKKVIEQILKRNRVCILSLCGEGGIPYAVPMNYGYDADTFYLHSGKLGKKIELLKKNQNVNIVVYEDKGMVKADLACDYSFSYTSVICQGKAEFLESSAEKESALKNLMELIAGMKNAVFGPGQLDRIHVIKVKVTEMTGKGKE